MDNIVRNNVRKATPSQQVRPNEAMASASMKQRKRTNISHLLTGAAIGAAITIGVVALWSLFAHQGQELARDRYQAVILDDGKVFFGKLQNTKGDYLTLKDAYYTQQQKAASNDEVSVEQTGQVNLVKVGEEIYGPDGGSMAIRADQVLFWQNLTADNQIVKAIKAK